MFGRFRASLCTVAVLWFATSRAPAAAPTLQYLTYLGGNGLDRVNAVGADPAGNIVVAGYTTSTNFPGASGVLSAGVSIFVTKLNASGNPVLFTTILGSDNIPGIIAVTRYDYVTSLDVDVDGSIYVAGYTNASSFPATANAWSKTGRGGFLAKLDSGGRVVYATFLPFGMFVRRVRGRNGVLYAGGDFIDPAFLGTSGAAQRDFAGGRGDLFVLAMNADGSAPLYLTAAGSPGAEVFSDFVFDTSGGVIVAGSSDSADFPTTSDALFPASPSPGRSASVLVRLDSTLAHITYSSWLPGLGSAMAATPDGNYVITGGSLDPQFTGGAPLNNITLTPGFPVVIAKMSSASNRPMWSTALSLIGANFAGMAADAQGNLIWTSFSGAFSGGSLSQSGSAAIVELSADGTRLLYGSPLPATLALVAPEPSGTILIAGYSASTLLPATADALQPRRDPAPPGDSRNPQNLDDGFAGRVDLSSFASGNYFLTPNGLAVTWRLGEPVSAPVVVPVQFAGNPAAPLSITPSSRLTSTYTPGASPAVSVNADPSQAVAGTFAESVTVQTADNPNTTVVMPIALTVKPAVSFDVSTTQVDIHLRQGQNVVPVNVALTPHFGNEYFYFTADSSDRSWLFPFIDVVAGGYQLSINVGNKPPGVYNGTVTLSLQGLQNAKRIVAVRYTIDPPATIQLSTYHLSLHVIKGQPFQPVTVDVTGSVPGVKFDLFTGMRFGWVDIRQTAQLTPGQIVISADTNAANVGYTGWSFSVTGEDGKQLVVNYDLDVSTGAPFDVSPAAIDLQWIRGTPIPPNQLVTFTTAVPGTVQWSADKPWVSPRVDSGPTPRGVYLSFDSTLPEGVYQATITATAAGVTKTLPITWRLYDSPRLAFSVTQLSFRYRIGGPLPAAQPIGITTPTLLQAYVSVGFANGFAKVDPAYGTTPITLDVTVDPAGLSAGTYTTNLTIYPQFPGAIQSLQFPIALIVDPDPNAPNAAVTRVTDAASYLPGSVAPGELLVIFGTGLGPATLVQAQPSLDGRFPTSLAGTTVYFDETAAPILYASSTQLAVVAPFGITGKTGLTVDLSGKRTSILPLNPSATNPGLFTANASGSGLVAALNVAAGNSVTVHGADAPVARGGILTLYATGAGATTPALADGILVTAPLPVLNSPLRVLIGGLQATVLYAGPAPGLIAGVTQINVRVPDTALAGLNPVLIVAGEIASQPGVTIAVK